MNALFILTHLTMLVCMLTILYATIAKTTNPNPEVKKWVMPFASFKPKRFRLTRLDLYRTALGLITIIMR